MEFMSLDLFYVILPIGLSVLTWLLIFVFRAIDKNNYTLQKIKMEIDKYKSELAEQKDNYTEELAEISNSVKTQEERANISIDDVKKELSEIETYSEDLNKLRGVLEDYRTRLEELRKVTLELDKRCSALYGECGELDKQNDRIKGFYSDIEEVASDYEEQKRKLETLRDSSVQEMEKAVGEFVTRSKSKVDDIFEDGIQKCTDAFKSVSESHSSMMEELTDKQKAIRDLIAEQTDKSAKYVGEVIAALREKQDEICIKEETLQRLEDQRINAERELENIRNARAAAERDLAKLEFMLAARKEAVLAEESASMSASTSASTSASVSSGTSAGVINDEPLPSEVSVPKYDFTSAVPSADDDNPIPPPPVDDGSTPGTDSDADADGGADGEWEADADGDESGSKLL